MARKPRITSRIAAIAVMGALAAAGIGYALWHSARVMSVASAFYAKTLCSGVFVAGRQPGEVTGEDVLADMTVGLRHWDGEIDRERGVARASLYGLAAREALYRPGLGCTLVTDTSVEALRRQAGGYTPAPPASSLEPWPAGSRVDIPAAIEGVDTGQLERAVNDAFAEPRPHAKRRTRAVVVVRKGRIVAERYAPGFSADTPQLGWSMGKSVVNALAGALVREGRLSLQQDHLFPEWEGDRRARITVAQLLRMMSGLDFDQPHDRMLSDVRKMLFLEGDSAAYARAEQSVLPPGASWFYASGSTTLLAAAMRDAVGGPLSAYFAYPRAALFGPLGMESAVIEPDAAGTFLAPAFVYASARDWARLGLLYLNDGEWRGKRILPRGWVQRSLEPAPHSGGQYGAHLWLEIPDFLRPAEPDTYKLPEDAFYMLGHDGQMVAIVPSRELVVVRLGLSRRRNAWDHERFLHGLLRAFPE